MSMHTPGPWKVAKPQRTYRDGNLMYGIVGPECVIDYEDWGFTEADARLIAAAPDLLEALKELADYVRTDLVDSDIARRVEAAIAKAEVAS